MSKIFTSKNYQNLINKKVGTNTPFSKLFKDLRCQIFPLWIRYILRSTLSVLSDWPKIFKSKLTTPLEGRTSQMPLSTSTVAVNWNRCVVLTLRHTTVSASVAASMSEQLEDSVMVTWRSAAWGRKFSVYSVYMHSTGVHCTARVHTVQWECTMYSMSAHCTV